MELSWPPSAQTPLSGIGLEQPVAVPAATRTALRRSSALVPAALTAPANNVSGA